MLKLFLSSSLRQFVCIATLYAGSCSHPIRLITSTLKYSAGSVAGQSLIGSIATATGLSPVGRGSISSVMCIIYDVMLSFTVFENGCRITGRLSRIIKMHHCDL